MRFYFVSKMWDGEFLVKEAYFGRGGIKVVNEDGVEDAPHYASIQEIKDEVENSMYKMGAELVLDNELEAKIFLNLKTEDFVKVGDGN